MRRTQRLRVNDVQALRGGGALAACAQNDVGVVLMHMRGERDLKGWKIVVDS